MGGGGTPASPAQRFPLSAFQVPSQVFRFCLGSDLADILRDAEVIFISGDHLEIADTGVDLAVASRLGTLLAGRVRFHG
ncbi:hypothetical protein ACX8Z9_12420 [Arthrobacter halodurans]|uniref:Uncharacterized protein n=1 Tax=Arthrobacter halodurans TaxID=516699 RepID=A0ABV4UM22_9MICC